MCFCHFIKEMQTIQQKKNSFLNAHKMTLQTFNLKHFLPHIEILQINYKIKCVA